MKPACASRPFRAGWVFAAACLTPLIASAGASTSIELTGLRVAVTALARGAVPAVRFGVPSGSSAESDATYGEPACTESTLSAGASAFGAVSTLQAPDASAGSSAWLDGDAFGDGATVRTAAFARGDTPGSVLVQSTIGLANGVSAATFTLAPQTRMTITADVVATASVTDGSPLDYADSGLSLAVTDSDGVGPQFARIDFDAFALGLFGAVDDVETTSVSLSYENDTDADLTGLFSGEVASLACTGGTPTAVPEPPSATMLLAALLLAAAMRARMKKAGKSRPDSVDPGA